MALWLGQVIRGRAGRVLSWSMRGMPLVILRRREPSSLHPTASISLLRCLGCDGKREHRLRSELWLLGRLPCSTCFAVCVFAL